MERFTFVFTFCVTIFLGQVMGVEVGRDWRIIGGKDAAVGQFPYQVYLEGFAFFCGGAILNSKWILTAAHCIIEPIDKVMVGSIYLNKGGTYYSVSKVVLHEEYNNLGTYKNDIGLILLKEEIEFSPTVRSIELETNEVIKVPAVVSGWGRLKAGHYPYNLQFLYTETVPLTFCNEELKKADLPLADESQVCDFADENSGTCYGDSGSPLVANKKVIGLASYGRCAKGVPMVNTRVSYFKEWIQRKISENTS